MKPELKKLSYIEGIGSIIINTALFVLKYWVGLITGSVGIIADAWHTLSDSITSIVVVLGAWISSKPADEGHPFGHGRAESVASIIVGVLLFIVGSNFFIDSVQRLKNKEGAMFSTSAIIIFIISMITKEALAQFSFWAFKKTKCHTLKADGWHHRSDSIASAIILISIVLGNKLWWIDGVFGIIISLLIAYTAINLVKEAAQPILGNTPEQSIIDHILLVAERYKLNGVHRIHEHSYGTHFEYTMHVYMPKNNSLHKVHKVIDGFRKDLRKEVNIEATVHIEPH